MKLSSLIIDLLKLNLYVFSLTTLLQFQSSDKYFLENTARVRDIELLTGIKFFSGLPPAEQARIKTIFPAELWV